MAEIFVLVAILLVPLSLLICFVMLVNAGFSKMFGDRDKEKYTPGGIRKQLATGPYEVRNLFFILLAVMTFPCWFPVLAYFTLAVYCEITGQPFVDP